MPRPAADLHVLRLCSVFEPPETRRRAGPGALPGELDSRAARFDPIGGMQNHTATLTRCLDARGVRQTVVTARLAGPRGTTPLGRGARVHRTGLPVPRLRQLWALAGLLAVLRAGRPTPVDVVHAHQGEDLATLLLGRLAARVHRCPLVVTLHCSVGHTLTGRGPKVRLLRALGGRVERGALCRADAVVVLTERTAAAVRDDGVPADRLSTIPSGFDPSLFTGSPADVFPGVARPRIGYVGRLAPQKSPGTLVEAFGRMREEAALVVVGDGPDRALVHRLAATSPATGRITLAGFVEHARVPAVLGSLDVLVLPSAYEEMGSVLTEAMAAGLPVVASRVGGIPEVVRHGDTGLLVPPGDVDALAAALDRVTGDAALRARLAAGARARAVDYSWPALAGRVAEVYDRVLGVPAVEQAAA
ncbi:glycosyltransferase involved in cell wall biosynthesis [Geodermatophilus tzadiensis]|uniref:Glycosyltransferase involved in cell wall biosynthesis n=1 Tax=Geodermatophilus tzadiensis TaxID=1137988 RepID=A0A2T0TWU5_9ACTN|nr:glycosyltransferase [Geodermatophilus tzadiensis]PRY49988.1 glycosyltransferase involved in cell wall biosynthesis [Geodermatophilus tzadiensis]